MDSRTLQPPFGPSMDSLSHPYITTTNLSPILSNYLKSFQCLVKMLRSIIMKLVVLVVTVVLFCRYSIYENARQARQRSTGILRDDFEDHPVRIAN